MHAAASRRGPLRAGELAEAVVLADLTLVTAIAGQLLPAPIGTALLIIAVVPMAVLGARNRFRAVLAGTFSAAGVGFLVLGLPVVQTVFACAAIGGVVGFAARRDWGIWRAVGLAVGVLWPAVASFALLFLWTFSRNRELVLEQISNSFSGISRLLRNVNLEGASKALEDAVDVLVDYWWLTVPALLLIFIVLATVFAFRIATPALRRVHLAFPTDAIALDPDEPPEASDPAPVPAQLRAVSYRYPGAD